MDTQINLTDNEIKALKTCLNYHNREDELDDNATWLCEKRVARELNWNHHQVAGLISAMLQKRIIRGYAGSTLMKKENNGNVTYYYGTVTDYIMTPKGINAYFDAIGQ